MAPWNFATLSQAFFAAQSRLPGRAGVGNALPVGQGRFGPGAEMTKSIPRRGPGVVRPEVSLVRLSIAAWRQLG
ncbi:hypothetical protein LSM04_004903 [Trypanosoma melophagium]|uniref:uncharacterized protein n=1 Tax=Trypanosoma melophagium TaxID=715481 RepID=UPI00351A0DE6|nr:hypothetical protein LSM04_004903 [Trypanosoma melophagium]